MQKTVRNREPWSKRPRFAPKQLLDAGRLNAGLDDELRRQRLLNLALHGWGVVFGYQVELREGGAKNGCLSIACGLALDRHGRMLYSPDCLLTMDDIEGKPPPETGAYTLLAHYAERVEPPDDCGPCPSPDPQWTEHGVVFTLRPGCQPVDPGCPPPAAGECISHIEFIRRRIGGTAGHPGPAGDLDAACGQPGSMIPTECATWYYDAAVGVPIACVEICDRAAGDASGYESSTGSPKDESCLAVCSVLTDQHKVVRHVYRTPLLYELINCCDVDLARVDRVSWAEWLAPGWQTPVRWDEFAARIGSTQPETGFSIRFTKPIRVDTIHDASIIAMAIPREPLADYWLARRIPMREIRPIGRTGDVAMGALLLPTADWLQAEVTGTNSSLFPGARFEIVVRGQLLRDEYDRMLDARPPGVDERCQERPGDDFVSAFEVGRRAGQKDDYLR